MDDNIPDFDQIWVSMHGHPPGPGEYLMFERSREAYHEGLRNVARLARNRAARCDDEDRVDRKGGLMLLAENIERVIESGR